MTSFQKWLDKNPSKLSEIYTKERHGFAFANFIERDTLIGAAIVHMVNPSNHALLLETFLVVLCNYELTDIDIKNVVGYHLQIVNSQKENKPASELYIQVDDELNTVDYALKTIPIITE